MYDNSASIALAGSGVALLGHTASLAVLSLGGALILAMGIATRVGGRRNRSRR